MAVEQVDTYQRRTKKGQVVTVRSHDRAGQEAAVQALARPGRPPIAAQPGQFPGGRAIPGVFITPPMAVEGTEPPPQPLTDENEYDEFGKKIPDRLRTMLEPHFDAKTGKPRKGGPADPSAKTQKVIAAASNLLLGDDNLIMLVGDE
jgi:hypothetical protein